MPLSLIIKELKIEANSHEEKIVTAAYKNCICRLNKVRNRKAHTNVDTES